MYYLLTYIKQCQFTIKIKAVYNHQITEIKQRRVDSTWIGGQPETECPCTAGYSRPHPGWMSLMYAGLQVPRE